MSNPIVTTVFSNPDPSVTVATTQELIDLLNTLVATAIQGTYIPYVIGSTTPAVGDQDKAWIRTDGAGRPMGTYVYYGGSWRKSPTGLTKEIRQFTGNPATYFDTSGLGLQSPDDWDGWAISNGGNGTTNLSNLFLVGSDMSNGASPPLVSGYAAGWNTKVTGNTLGTGGADTYTLGNDNFPFTQIQLTGFSASGSASHSEKKAIVTGGYDSSTNGGDGNTVVVGSFGADPSTVPPTVQVAVPTVPPFYALAYCEFVGYA